jgi:hypothetical protein
MSSGFDVALVQQPALRAGGAMATRWGSSGGGGDGQHYFGRRILVGTEVFGARRRAGGRVELNPTQTSRRPRAVGLWRLNVSGRQKDTNGQEQDEGDENEGRGRGLYWAIRRVQCASFEGQKLILLLSFLLPPAILVGSRSPVHMPSGAAREFYARRVALTRSRNVRADAGGWSAVESLPIPRTTFTELALLWRCL